MNSERQHGWSRQSVSTRAGVPPASTTAIVTSPSPHNAVAGSLWLNQPGSNGATSGNKRKRHLQGGRWVQITYALIDICCIVLNGAIAYSLRFPPEQLRSFFSSRHLR